MDLECYRKVYRQYFRLARKVACNVLHDFDLADDVAQDVFLEMYLKREKLNEEEIKYWVILYSGRRAIDAMVRSYRRQEISYGLSECMEPHFHVRYRPDPEDYVIRQEQVKAMLAALTQLRLYNGDWFDVLMEKSLDNVSYKELARSHAIREETLRVQIHRARKWLNRRMMEIYEINDSHISRSG